MLRLKDFDLANWSTWRRGHLPLDVPGITFVRGKNQDRQGSNGTGKSSLFNGLYALLHGDHQFAARRRSLGNITSANTKMRLRGWREDRPFVASMTNTTLSLSIDGKALENRSKDSARKALHDNVIRMSPELWSSMVHVNGIASNPLIRGTSSQRCAFLESAFDLNRWAEKYSAVGDIVSGMKRAAADLDDAKRELATLPAAVNVDAMRDKLERLARLSSDQEARVSRLRDKLAKYRALPARPDRDVSFYECVSTNLEKEIHSLRRAAEDYARWVVEKEHHASAEEDRAAAERDLRSARVDIKSRDDLDIDSLRSRIERLESEADGADAARENIAIINRWRDAAATMARRHGIKYSGDVELRSLSQGWASSLRHGDSRCPVCGSNLKGRVDRRDLDALVGLVRRLPADLDVRPPRPGLSRRLEWLRRKLRSAEKYLDAKKRLSSIPVVKLSPEPEHDPGRALVLARKLSAANELKRRAEAWQGVDDKDADVAEDVLRRAEERLAELRSELDDLKARLSDGEAAERLRESVEGRVERLSGEVLLHPVYRALHGAYSTSGIRLWMLSEMLEAIVSSLNATVGSDRVSYGYKLSRNRELTLTVSNLSGTFDVRMLSGGESGVFCVNLVTALLPLLPDHKRCSILILDEVDANVDFPNRRLLENEYLPRLAEIVPTMFIVTPYNREHYYIEGANEIEIVKKNSVSRFAG